MIIMAETQRPTHESALPAVTSLLPQFLHLDSSVFTPAHFILLAVGLIIPISCRSWLFRSRNAKVLPGPWSWPLIGHVQTMCCRPHLALTELHSIHGDMYQLRVGQRNVVVVGCLEGILEGLGERADTLSGRPDFLNYHLLYDEEEGRHRGLCTSDCSEKSTIRKSFLCASLDTYCSDSGHIEEKLSSEIVDTVKRLLDSEVELDPFLLLKPACFNIIFRLVFGQRFDPQGGLMKETLATADSRASLLRFQPTEFCPLLKMFSTDDHAKYIQDRTSVQLQLHHRYLNLHKDTYDPSHMRDMTDHLLHFVENGEDYGVLGQDDLDYLLLDTVTFGYEAMAVTLTWLLGYVASDLDIQADVQRELDLVVGRDRLPGVEDQPYLPLTIAAILESIRLASVYPFLQPHSATEESTVQGYQIPKESLVLFNVWKLHHDPQYWTCPHVFDPSRFLDSENQLEIPDYFIPFGSGPRQCPGEGLVDVTLFLFFATIMHQATVKPAAGFLLCGEFRSLIRPKAFCLSFTDRT